MWLCTVHGFVSIVQKGPHGKFCIRARDKAHLQAIFRRCKSRLFPKMPRIYVNAGTDYRYRAFLTKAQMEAVVVSLVNAINYDNFKDRVKEVRPADRRYQLFLGDVWQAGFQMQTFALFK